MTDQHSSLSSAALKAIITGVDRSLAVFDRYDRSGKYLSAREEEVRKKLHALRRLLEEQLAQRDEG